MMRETETDTKTETETEKTHDLQEKIYEEKLKLAENLALQLEELKNLLKNYHVPESLTEKHLGLVEELIKELQHKNSEKATILVFGRTGVGKTSLILSLSQMNPEEAKKAGFIIGGDCSQTGEARLLETQYCNYIDTRGLLEKNQPKQEDTAKTAEESIKKAIQIYKPDIVLYCINPQSLRDNTLNEEIPKIKKLIDFTNENREEHLVPVIVVITKMDENLPFSQKHKQYDDLYEKELTNRKIKVKEETKSFPNYENIKTFGCVTKITEEDESNFDRTEIKGIELLQEYMEVVSPIYKTFSILDLKNPDKIRKKIADRIIILFTFLNAAISILPGLDIFLIWLTTEIMCKLLSVLSVSQERTYQTYCASNSLVLGLIAVLRTGLLAGDLVFQLSGALTVVGIILGMSVGAISTFILGKLAFRYFSGGEINLRDVQEYLKEATVILEKNSLK